jgi:hypothetical protein
MKNKIAVIVAALALAFTVQTSKAQTAPAPAAPISITQTQFANMITASGVTLISGKSATDVQQFNLSGGMMAPMATPIAMRIMYLPTTGGGTITQTAFISSTACAAIIAAGATLTVATPRQVGAGQHNGVYVEAAQ